MTMGLEMICDDKYVWYRRRYSNFSPGGWSVSETSTGFAVRLPNGYSFTLDSSSFPIDWHAIFDFNHVSTRLWHRSLVYLCELVTLNGGWSMADAVLQDFLSFLRRVDEEPNVLGMNSLDHAVGLQIRTVCDLKVELFFDRSVDSDLRQRIDSGLDEIVLRLESIARQDGFFLINNHGLMLGLSLIHSSYVFPYLERSAGVLQNDVRKIGRAHV